MTQVDEGKNMSEDNQSGLGTTAQNEFAPNIVAGKPVAPAQSPKSKAERRAERKAAEAAKSAEQPAKAEGDGPSEADFLEYVHGELSKVANEFGYDVIVKKRNAPVGPVMMYNRETLEGKVFDAREEAGADYMSGDELQELRARQREAAE